MKQTTLILVTLFTISVFTALPQKEKRLPYILQEGTTVCDTIYTLPDRKAEFPGGTSAMYNFFKQHLQNSEELTNMLNSSRRMTLQLLVDTNGDVLKSEVITSMTSDYDKDALNVASRFPRLMPARVQGRAVCSYLIIPLHFE